MASVHFPFFISNIFEIDIKNRKQSKIEKIPNCFKLIEKKLSGDSQSLLSKMLSKTLSPNKKVCLYSLVIMVSHFEIAENFKRLFIVMSCHFWSGVLDLRKYI